jgi:6-phosphogluconolactonase
MNSVHVFSDSNAMAEEISRCWMEQAIQTKNDQRVFSVVLSGGNTAPILYKKLAAPELRNHICWNFVHIFFSDERCVPPDNSESNYKNISDHLLNHLSIPEANIHRMRGEENPEKESLRYAKDIQAHLALRKGDINFFDWVFLGIGEDGHTASLFPNETIISSTKLCETARHPDTGQTRITMTPAAITKSARITYHVVGENKSEIIHELISNPSPRDKYPALKIQGEWFLDKKAASKIDFY